MTFTLRLTALFALAPLGGCTSVNAYAVPEPLGYGKLAVGAVTPVLAEASDSRTVEGAPRKLENRSRQQAPLSGQVLLRLGVGRGWEIGAQTENQGVALYAQQRVYRGVVDVAWRAAPGVAAGHSSVLGALLVGMGGGQGPVVGLGTGWFGGGPAYRTTESSAPGPVAVVPRGQIFTATLGVRTRVSGSLAVHPEIGLFQGRDSRGMTLGLAWIGAQR